MKKLSLILIGIAVVLLIGLAAWQLMWMSDVVDNYDATKPYKRSEMGVHIKDDRLKEYGSDAETAYQTAADKNDTVADDPVNVRGPGNEKRPKEENKSDVLDQSSDLENREIKNLPVEISDAGRDDREGNAKDAEKKESAIRTDNMEIREDDDTVSIKLKSDKPLSPRKQGITDTPASPEKPLNIPAPSIPRHATSTPPY